MAKRAGNKLEKWEVAIVKAMLSKKYIPQDIQAYFSRPTRSINHARISEIRDEAKHKSVKPATEQELDVFLDAWPDVDPISGLHLQGDELLVKAREAMVAAIHTFNGVGLFFEQSYSLSRASSLGPISCMLSTKGKEWIIDTKRTVQFKPHRMVQKNTGNWGSV